MRWEDEQYVRLYKRDTLTWLRLGWQGQAVLSLLFRKVDRAGLLEIDDEEPASALSAVTGIPTDVTTVAWERFSCGTKPVVTLSDKPSRALFIPNFLEAQEAQQSDKARQKKHREIAVAHRTITEREEASQGVTDNHAQSRAVTLSLADLSPLSPAVAGDIQASLLPDSKSPALVFMRAEWPVATDPPGFEQRALKAFPGVDLLAEFRAARGWEVANGKGGEKKKPGRFLWNWLKRAHTNLRAGNSTPRFGEQPQGNAPGAEKTQALLDKYAADTKRSEADRAARGGKAPNWRALAKKGDAA